MTSTVLFDQPQTEIASLIVGHMARASKVSIVTGFATPGGLAAICAPIRARPLSLHTLVVGSATYPGFEVLDELLSAGVPPERLHIHLGHTAATSGRKHPFARFRPMLHSKIYYMEYPDGNASAFVGSHNVTAFALGGLNGEAAVLLEGEKELPEFEKVRQHIAAARNQAIVYSPSMKEAYAWWTKEFIEGLKAEMKLPHDGTTVRTILLFASAGRRDRPRIGENLYFEIPVGIEQIESLKTETHLFLFDSLPATPWQALELATSASARYTCITLGAENKQGNKELVAQWRIDLAPQPTLVRVPGATHRPSPRVGMQQVRAEIMAASVEDLEYLFDRAGMMWFPEFAPDDELAIDAKDIVSQTSASLQLDSTSADLTSRRKEEEMFMIEARGDFHRIPSWRRVKGLVRLDGSPREKDEAALKLVAPESGSFILVSLRRRKRNSNAGGQSHN
jgi:hypothetical protein